MKEFAITTPVRAYAYDELDEGRRSLIERAREYTDNSYAPYSGFRVGAAIRLADGTVVCGANQENAAYPSGTCAERSACFAAGANHPGVPFEAIAIAARGTDGQFLEQPIAPCGACRQALLEYEKLAGRPVEVLLAGRDEVYVLPSVASTLPLTFSEII